VNVKTYALSGRTCIFIILQITLAIQREFLHAYLVYFSWHLSFVPSAVSDAVQERFPHSSVSDIKQAMRQKCSDAVKQLKYKAVIAAKTTAENN